VSSPDNLVVEGLGAAAVVADVVGAPPLAEFVAAGRQLTHEVLEVLVVGVAAGLGAQDGDGYVGEQVPVGVEPAGALVEEGEPGEIAGRKEPRVAVSETSGSATATTAYQDAPRRRPEPMSEINVARPALSHGSETVRPWVICRCMLDAVFRRARVLLGGREPE
jgi:hypothetical protein